MSDIPLWLQLLMGLLAVLWVVSIIFFIWVAFTAASNRAKVQYYLVRMHFFKDFDLEPATEPLDEASRLTQMALIRILRLIVSAIAFINFITALVLILTGWWLSTVTDDIGLMIQVLVLLIAPLLALLSIYSLVLYLLMNGTYRRMMKNQLADMAG